MARTLTPKDIAVILNKVIDQATGDSALVSTDLTDFVSVGENLMASGKENVLNALSLVLGRLIVAVRPYNAKFALIDAENSGIYSNRLRKVSYYTDPALSAGNWNTQLFTNLEEGFTNGQNPNSGGTPQSTKSMWEQKPRIPLELNFGGSSVWQTALTTYEYQLQQAFRSAEDFGRFAEGILTQLGNEIEMQKENFNRLTVLNFIAGLYDVGATSSVVNLTTAINTRNGTSYTTQQILEAHRDLLAEELAIQVKTTARKLTYNSNVYHISPALSDGRTILRHTPLEDQRLFLSAELMDIMEASVMPQIFNPQYLSIDNYEAVGYWQDIKNPNSINITPSIPDVATWQGQTAGNAVTDPLVVGLLFDRDAIMTDWILDRTATTPIEARKGYYNTWYSFSKNAINDFTENAVLFIMED